MTESTIQSVATNNLAREFYSNNPRLIQDYKDANNGAEPFIEVYFHTSGHRPDHVEGLTSYTRYCKVTDKMYNLYIV